MLFSSHIDVTAYTQSCLLIRIFINSIGKKIKLPFNITADMSATALGGFVCPLCFWLHCTAWGILALWPEIKIVSPLVEAQSLENQGCLATGFLLGKGFSLIFHATAETQLSDCSPLLITLPRWSAWTVAIRITMSLYTETIFVLKMPPFHPVFPSASGPRLLYTSAFIMRLILIHSPTSSHLCWKITSGFEVRT